MGLHRRAGGKKNKLKDTHLPPEQLIQSQLDCYNAKDIEGLLATYAADVEHHDLRGNLLARGRAQLRERFATRFTEPDLQARLVQRIVMGNVVTDYEIITRNFPSIDPDFPNAKGTIEMLCIYEVENNEIVRATFATGRKLIA
jgi:hypothetical protein